ncbi:MAG: phosphoribosylformylglycinamidine cyclo-ligase [Gemmatimonadota bacterium]
MSGSQYAAAGVSLATADAARARIAALVAGTRTPLSAGAIGAFGGMVRIPDGLRQPLLVMSTDGVGTKVLVAQEAGRLDTVGEDLVNHSVNDILVHGATPIAFQDYVAGNGLTVEAIAAIVEGVARGCRNHRMVLSGGETAQMPGLYQPGHFDLAGTILGVVEADQALHGDRIVPGDVLLGYASTGLHTNGFTLARRVLFEVMGLTLDQVVPQLGTSVGEALLAVHRSYQAALQPVLSVVHGLAHITGGGVPGNLVRVLPQGSRAQVRTGAWPEPALFGLIRDGGKVSDEEMLDVFNLGIGMIALLPAEQVEPARQAAAAAAVETWVIGEVVPGATGVECH